MTDARQAGSPLVARAAKSTIGSLFRAQARLHPTHVALQDAGGTLDFATLDARTDQLATALVARGVVAGARRDPGGEPP